MDYRRTVKDALANKVLLNDVFEVQTVRETEAIRLFLDKWVGEVDTGIADPNRALLNYLIQPQLSPTKSADGAHGKDVPVYRMDYHLARVVSTFAEKNGMKDYNKRLITDVENIVNGKNKEPFIYDGDRHKTDYYDWNKLGDLAGPVQFLARWHGVFYADPFITDVVQGLNRTSKNRIIIHERPNGENQPVRKTESFKNSYHQIIRNKREGDGSGCY